MSKSVNCNYMVNVTSWFSFLFNFRLHMDKVNKICLVVVLLRTYLEILVLVVWFALACLYLLVAYAFVSFFLRFVIACSALFCFCAYGYL